MSPGCLDLLRRILVPDPNQRISIQDIYRHHWFMENEPVEVSRASGGGGVHGGKCKIHLSSAFCLL